MKKSVFGSLVCAALLTACGGGGGGSSSATGGTTIGGTTGGATTGGTTTGVGTVDPADLGGQSGTFGDSALQANGQDAETTVCAAGDAVTFTGWVRLTATQWCVEACPSNISNVEGGAFALIPGSGEVCRDTPVAGGGADVAPLFAPINGCPVGGCTDNDPDDFPQVFVSSTASAAELGQEELYRCVGSLFDETTDRWGDDPTIPAFSLGLGADGSAGEFAAGATRAASVNNTTWSFSNGTLNLESGLSLSNVAVANGSFSSWNSNTALIRCIVDQ